MSINLIDVLNKYLTSDVVGKLADYLGESPQNTGSAVKLALPSLLAGIVRKCTNSQEASQLLNLLQKDRHDGGLLESLPALLAGGSDTQSLFEAGSKVFNTLFSGNGGNLANLIAKNSGVSNKSATSLLGFAMPLVLGVIGKQVKADGIGNATQLINFLRDQSGYLKNLLPAGIATLLGFSGFDGSGPGSAPGSAWRRFWPLLLLIPLAIWGLLKSCSLKEELPSLPEPKIEAPAVSVPAVVNQVSNFFEETLPTGFAIKGALQGIESKLVSFIKDASRPVDKDTWFTMDGITFDTGKATLRPESNVQLANIAEIMKAFPAVTIKIGGYTDNTGDAKANQTLSADRANAVRNALVVAGIEAARLEAEGYGSDHPVATNDTEEGRQQNRRIDVRVLSK